MITKYQLSALLIMAAFYLTFLTKMLIQKKQGIVTNQVGKDKSDRKRYVIETIMGYSTVIIVVVELISIFFMKSFFCNTIANIGIAVGIIGDIVFITAVITMGNSWRAGVAADDHRKLVSGGIFKISRNPAFLGFDLVYISILLMFFYVALIIATVFTMIMLHLQILQEEKYLQKEFGEEYLSYQKKTCRYLGRKMLR